jgi:PTS system nitrogen regulatory IIA component
VAAFIRLAEPIPFDAPDGKPVQLLIFLLVPEHATQMHLEILSELAQMLSDPKFRDSLHAAAAPAEAWQLLAGWEPFRPAA